MSGFATAMRLGLCIAALFAADAQAARYRLAVEPSYPAEQAEEVYKPLVEYLNRTTGHRFELVLSRNYHAYWRDLREDLPVDFAFDEAHFADYRIQHNGFVPVARVAEPMVYSLLAQSHYEGQGMRAVIGLPVACVAAPSLGFALLAEMYEDNPVAQPAVRSEAVSWRDSLQMLLAGEVEGAMVPAHLAKDYPYLVELARSAELPGQAFTAAPSVDAADVAAVREALNALHEDPALYNVLVELGASRFESALASDYAGYEKVLAGFYGYSRATRGVSPIEASSEDAGSPQP